jgi:hypothetical protein
MESKTKREKLLERHASYKLPLPKEGSYRTGLKLMNSLWPIDPVEFIPENGKVINWYTCGPTVYSDSHLGHGRCYVVWDIVLKLLQRLLQVRGELRHEHHRHRRQDHQQVYRVRSGLQRLRPQVGARLLRADEDPGSRASEQDRESHRIRPRDRQVHRRHRGQRLRLRGRTGPCTSTSTVSGRTATTTASWSRPPTTPTTRTTRTTPRRRPLATSPSGSA